MNERRKEILDSLDNFLETWTESKPKVLTSTDIAELGTFVRKNMLGQSLNDRERKMKSYIHLKLAGALADIERMIDYGFIGKNPTRWNPKHEDYKKGKDRDIWNINTWSEDFPIKRVCKLVNCLAEIYGDSYAIPLLTAIQDGLGKRPENYELVVEVRATKYSKYWPGGFV